MNCSLNHVLRGKLAIGVAGLLLLGLTGCGADLLTWSQDAKRQGMQQYADGRYADAAGAFRNAIRQNPQDPESEYWLAMSYEQVQSYHEAIDAYRTCLKLMPPAGTVYYNVAMHDSAFDRLARIVAKFDDTGRETDLIAQEATQSHSSEDYRLLGRVFRVRGDADSGLDNYRKAVAIDPASFVAQRELGLYLEQLSQNQEAGQVLRDAYRLNQKDEQVNSGLLRLGIAPDDTLLPQPQARQVLPSIPVPESDIPAPASSTLGPAPDAPAPRE